MSGSAVVATTIFGVAMLVTIVLGVLSSRGRDKGFAEWSVSGRGLGVIFIWLLMAGETYTSFSFLGTAGWSYEFGVPILYLVGYLTVGLTVAYIVSPLLWTYAARHNLVSIADIAEHRFRSRPVGVLVAVVATIFLVPYIQLQIQGMGVVVNAMSYGAVDLKLAAIVSFVVAEAFILVSGMRGSAWVSVMKDLLVIVSVVFLAVFIPVHYFDGVGHLLDRLVVEKPDWLTLPGHDSPGYGGAWFISTIVLNGVTIVAFPNAVAGYLSAKDPTTLRRNAVLLPWYQLLLFIPMMIGAGALFVAPALGDDSDLALFKLVTDSLPAPVVAIIGVAGALSAIVPMAVFMLSIGTLWGKTVLGGGNGADPRSRVVPGAVVDPGRDLRNKRLSQLVCLVAGIVALGGSLFSPEALVNLSVLSYEGLAQLVPTVLLGLLWRRMSAAGAVSGLLVGSAVMVLLAATGNDPLWGVNGGLIALVPNVIITVAVSLARPHTPAPTRTGAATSAP